MGVFARIMEGRASEAAVPKTAMIDATCLKAHRTATSLRLGATSPLAGITHAAVLLAILLATRMRGQHWQIIAGIFFATILNHALAALVGREVAGLVESQWFRIAVALGFIAMAVILPIFKMSQIVK